MLERESVIALAASRFAFHSAKRVRAVASGLCLNCDERVPTAGLSYCDEFCRDDHQTRTRATARNGQTPQETFYAEP